MKALTLHQPWASLIVTGAKTWETRSWGTSYRGDLVIHAGARHVQRELLNHLARWTIQGVLAPSWAMTSWPLVFGAGLCVVTLTDCRQTDSLTQAEIGHDRPFGDFSPGRYAWKLENVRPFDKPVPAKGHLGLWEWVGEVT